VPSPRSCVGDRGRYSSKPAGLHTFPHRGFLPWRFSYAGPCSPRHRQSLGRHPKTLYERELVKALLHGDLSEVISFCLSPAERHPSVPIRNLSRPSRAGPVKNGRRADRSTCRLISRPLLEWPEHEGRLGRVGIAARRACLQEIGPPRIYREHPTDINQLSISAVRPVRVERVQQVQRRCPWARAIIASPYIRQLRYGLPLCCMHGRSREKDGAHLHNGRLARANLRWFSPATHPTRPTLH
jgi:hypothetical protein